MLERTSLAEFFAPKDFSLTLINESVNITKSDENDHLPVYIKREFLRPYLFYTFLPLISQSKSEAGSAKISPEPVQSRQK